SPTHGNLAFNTDGSFTYTPFANYFNTKNSVQVAPLDSFTYTVKDDGNLVSTATVRITVNNVNQPPTGVNDVFTIKANTPLNTNVLSNDTDPDNDVLSVATVTVNGSPATLGTPAPTAQGGSVTVSATGTLN